jgi:feruloyl esterase
MFALLWVSVVSHLALVPFAVASSAFEKKCLSFEPEKYIKDATRNVLQHVPAGTKLTFSDNDATCGRTNQVVSVDLCRMTLEIKTSRISKISFEAWFPEDWSGRFLATGNGGIDGCKCQVILERLALYQILTATTGIKYEDIAYGSSNGFATVGANNGHNGTTGVAFLDNPEMVVDFAWRS